MLMRFRRFLRRVKAGDAGFTLLEMVAVIAIIGILAGLVVPRIMTSQSESKAKAVEANVQMLQSAVERYNFDHEQPIPDAENDNNEWIDNYLVDNSYIAKVPTPGTYSIKDGIVTGTP